MSRTLGSAVLAAIYAQETDKVFLQLLTIDHPDLGSPIRLVDDGQDVTSRGDLYTAFPFTTRIPQEQEGELPRVELVIDNVSQDLVDEIRTLETPPTITLEIVVADAPDTVEAGPYEFTLKSTEYDQFVIRSQLAFEDMLTEPFPADRFTPTDFPGLFNAVS